MSEDDNLTFWLKMFMGFWVGGAMGMAAVGWMFGREFTPDYVAWRAIAVTVMAAVLATLRLLSR